MNPETILQIIKLSLEITLEIIRGIPIEEREKIWTDHQKNIQFWRDLFEKLKDAKP